MVLAGPGEVKNLLDEASGVKTYYIKREKTLRRLEQTTQNLLRAEDLIAEIEPRLKSLRRQAKKMEARAEIEQELKVYQREFFSNGFWGIQGVLSKIVEQLSGFQKQRQSLEDKAAALRKQVETMESSGQQSGGQFKDVQEELNKLLGEKNKILEDLSLVRGKMQSQKTAVAGDAQSLTVEVHNKQRKIEEVKASIELAKKEKQDTEMQFVGQFKALEDVNKKLNELSQKLSNPTQVDWVLVDRELTALENSWNVFYNQLSVSQNLQEIKQTAGSVAQNFMRFKTAAKTAIVDPQVASLTLKQQLDALLKSKEQLNTEVNSVQLNMSKSKMALEFLERELSGLNQEKLHFDLELKKAQSSSPDEFWKSLLEEEEKLKVQVDALGGDITKAESLLKDHYASEDARQKDLRQAESAFRDLQDQIVKIKDQESLVNIEKAKYDTQMQALSDDGKRALGQDEWQIITDKKIETQTADLDAKIGRLKNQLETIGGMDDLTLKEYQETESRHTTLTTQVTDLKQGVADLRQIIDELDEHIKQRFNESFHKINEKFEYYFRILFNGGRAYLSILKSDDEKQEVTDGDGNQDEAENTESLRPEEKILQKYEKGASNITGIDIKATPPNKKLASIQALSGGERALTSIALLCSLLSCFPSPFVVLDEVDAALDDANTIRFGQILGTLAHQTQFVTITHNRETMAQANILYGVTMGDDGISKLLSVKLEQAKQFAK